MHILHVQSAAVKSEQKQSFKIADLGDKAKPFYFAALYFGHQQFFFVLHTCRL